MSQEHIDEDLNEENQELHSNSDPRLFDFINPDKISSEESKPVLSGSKRGSLDSSIQTSSPISCSNKQIQTPEVNLKRKLNGDANSSKVLRKDDLEGVLNVKSEQSEAEGSLDGGCDWSVSVHPSTSSEQKQEPDNEQGGSKLRRAFSARKKSTLNLIVKNPFTYLGIPKGSLFVLRILSEKVPVSKEELMITLKKLRLDEPYLSLSHDFGMNNPEKVKKIFQSTLLVMNSYLSGLIFTPDNTKVQNSLPNCFRTSYANVRNILHCIDLRIKKPGDLIKNVLTYSDAHKENTLKYLVSFTPGGYITYVSNGHGGRISNEALVNEICYFGTISPEIKTIMTNFKFLESSFPNEMPGLIRLSSVRNDVFMSNEEKWYVEQYIARAVKSLEGFKMLTLSSLIDDDLLPYANKIVTVSCAVHNLQFYSKNPIDPHLN